MRKLKAFTEHRGERVELGLYDMQELMDKKVPFTRQSWSNGTESTDELEVEVSAEEFRRRMAGETR